MHLLTGHRVRLPADWPPTHRPKIQIEAMKNQKTTKADGKRDRMRHVNKAKTLKRKAQRQNKRLARAA